RRPIAAMRKMAEQVTAALRLPIPTTLSIAVESLTLGGSVLQRVGADLATGADGLDIKGLGFRPPRITPGRRGGPLPRQAPGVQFEGATRIEANDPRAFVAWLTEQSEPPAMASGSLRLAGDLTLRSDAMAIERLKVELDRMTMSGRLAYVFASSDRPARLDA